MATQTRNRLIPQSTSYKGKKKHQNDKIVKSTRSSKSIHRGYISKKWRRKNHAGIT